MKTENVFGTDEDKTGMIIEISHDPKYKFEEIKLRKKPKIETNPKGMSKVLQDLRLRFSNPGGIYNDLLALQKLEKGISILHISPDKKAYLYGEHKGLQIIDLTEDCVVLEGEEADTFFRVDYDLALSIIDTHE
jgi:hypothetical protein